MGLDRFSADLPVGQISAPAVGWVEPLRYPSRHYAKMQHDQLSPQPACRGCFFFTVNLAERHLHLLTEHIDKLRTAFRETRRHHPFTIDAMVVLPDHLHTVWTLPDGDTEFATGGG